MKLNSFKFTRYVLVSHNVKLNVIEYDNVLSFQRAMKASDIVIIRLMLSLLICNLGQSDLIIQVLLSQFINIDYSMDPKILIELTRMCDSVPNLWNSMAANCMRIMAKKKNTNTIPIGSK